MRNRVIKQKCNVNNKTLESYKPKNRKEETKEVSEDEKTETEGDKDLILEEFEDKQESDDETCEENKDERIKVKIL